MLRLLRRRQEARRLVQADAEALIRDYGPDEAYLPARGLARQALDRRRAAHWRRAESAVVRMTGKIVDINPAARTLERDGD